MPDDEPYQFGFFVAVLTYHQTRLGTRASVAYISRGPGTRGSSPTGHPTTTALTDPLNIHPTQQKWIPSSPTSPPPRPPPLASSRISLSSSRPVEEPLAVDASLLELRHVRYASHRHLYCFSPVLTTFFLPESDTAHSITTPPPPPSSSLCHLRGLHFIMPDSGLT